MMEEKKETTKEKDKIKTIQDGIFAREMDLKDINDPTEHKISLCDLIRCELSALPDGHSSQFVEKYVAIMEDKDNFTRWKNTMMDFLTALKGSTVTGDTIERLSRSVNHKMDEEKIGRLGGIEQDIARILDETDIKPVMGRRGKQKFEGKYGKVDDSGKIINP